MNHKQPYRLIQDNWEHELCELVGQANDTIRIMCPFVKLGTVERLISGRKAKELLVLTRFSLEDFYQGVSDPDALRCLLEAKAGIRGVKQLHSKLYIFDEKHAVVTSANLTQSAMHQNLELGILVEKPNIVSQCIEYFQKLWVAAGENLTGDRLESFEKALAAERAQYSTLPVRPNLPDEGVQLARKSKESSSPTSRGDFGPTHKTTSGNPKRDRFWEILLKEVRARGQLTIDEKPRYNKYIRIKTGIGNVNYQFVARTKSTSTIELIIQKGEQRSRQALLRLEGLRPALEVLIGRGVVFEMIGAQRDVARIEKTYAQAGYASREADVMDVSKKMVDDMILMQKLLSPEIKKLGLE